MHIYTYIHIPTYKCVHMHTQTCIHMHIAILMFITSIRLKHILKTERLIYTFYYTVLPPHLKFFLKGAHWGFNCLYCIFSRWFQICDQNLNFFCMFFFIAIYIFFKYMVLCQCASLYDNWDNFIISHQSISSYDNWDNFIYKFVVILDDLE